ncbi:putative COPII vesicles protein Yip3 [Hypomontagnella monticulosa]|nr:putative COPII vesicles protein Yip3 [Hypomontagnella monticulosa]
MARIQIPLDVLTSRLNIQDRFAGFRNTSLSSRFANMRPISEFLDFKRVSKPANFGEVQSRVNYNLGTFSSNYALVFVLLSIYALITNPLLLFDLVLLVAGLWLLGRLNGQDLTIGTFQATSSQLYTGLLVTCGLLFLIASPFTTVLWLIGGLDGRPRAPKFAPQWGRPSRRPRRGWEEEENDFWGTGRRVVEELDSDDTDTQGADLATTGNRRFASDPLRFTGIDLGGGAQPRNGHAYQHSDDGDSTEDDSHSHATSNEDTEDDNPATRELEEALVQSALSRIRRAQAKGKQDVKLNKEELAALERRRKRLQAEAEAAKRRNGGERKQRKEKEQRYAVPLSQFDPPDSEQSQQLVGPPMGRFPPPNASRSRPRSGTSSTSSTHRPQSSFRETSPFDYQYVNAPPNLRHASDPSARPSSSRLSLPHEEDWVPHSSSSRELRDPFQYQTAGPRAPYPDGAAAARLDAAGSDSAYVAVPRKPVPTAVRSSPRRAGNREERNEQEREDETTSDEGVTGARIGRNRSRAGRVVEPASPSPEPERPKSKKHSPPSQSTAKRKSTSGRKRKGK